MQTRKPSWLRLLALVGVVVLGTGALAACRLFEGPQALTSSISGVVSVAGEAVKGVTVSAGSQSVVTDSSGRFTISGLKPGTYKLEPSLSGYSFSPQVLHEKLGGTAISGANFDAGPAIPVPSSYSQNIPSRSQEILVGVKKLDKSSFSPVITGAYLQNPDYSVDTSGSSEPVSTTGWITTTPPSTMYGCESVAPQYGSGNVYRDWNCYVQDRYTLVSSSGTVVQNPTVRDCKVIYAATNCTNLTGTIGDVPVDIKPLTHDPLLELVAYWQMIATVSRYAAGTSTSETESVTYGVNKTSSQTFTNTVSASETSSIGYGPANLSQTVSDTYTHTTISSMTISNSTTTTGFSTSDLSITIAQQNDIVPLMTFFPAS